MSASTTIPVVATETAITALIEGQRFTSYDDFKIALEDWEIADNFTVRLGKLEVRCVTGVRAVPNCPFYIRAACSPIEECVIVIVLKARHNCISAAPVKHPAYSPIQRILPDTIVVTKNTTPRQIVHQFQLRRKKTIDAQAAKRAKHIFLATT
jgi:hypothetical protein